MYNICCVYALGLCCKNPKAWLSEREKFFPELSDSVLDRNIKIRELEGHRVRKKARSYGCSVKENLNGFEEIALSI